MDRTTLTAALKPLERRGLVATASDDKDKRARRLSLTDAGRELLAAAYPAWEKTQRAIDDVFPPARLRELRADIDRLAFGEQKLTSPRPAP